MIQSVVLVGVLLFSQLGHSLAEMSCKTIQKAIEALPADGGVVQLEVGTYVCDQPIVINRDWVTLEGKGIDRTIVATRSGLAMPVILIGEPKTDAQGIPLRETVGVTVQDLSVDGSLSQHSDPLNNECYDYDMQKSLFCKGGKNYVRNNGITIRRAKEARVFNVKTHANISGGIVTEKLSSNILIDGLEAYVNFYDGFAGYQTHGCVVRNFKIHSNYWSGVSVDVAFSGNSFEYGEVYANGDNGIYSANVGNNSYSHLSVKDNANYGFFIDGTRKVVEGEPPILIPNTCDDNSINDTEIAGARTGVFIAHICQNIILNRLKIANPNLDCIYEFPGSKVSQSEIVCERP